LTSEYLSEKYPVIDAEENILIKGSIVPTKEFVEAVKNLKSEETLVKDEMILAYRVTKENLSENESDTDGNLVEFEGDLISLEHIWQLFSELDVNLKFDFQLITKGRKSVEISKTNNVVCKENIFIEEGAKVEYASLNASDGIIYIGKDAEVMEGSFIRGPFALGQHSQLKMGTKIYGATSIGPFCKVGGEVSNSLLIGYSNKAHDGFLGNSVIGEWCNLGAGTNCSNLKNTYEDVRLWNYYEESFVSTGLQFCGLIMGDHSKTGINSMLNTGTVIGVNVNLFGTGFPRNFIPSFSWGGANGFKIYNLNKAIQVAERVYARRSLDFNEVEINILKHIFKYVIR